MPLTGSYEPSAWKPVADQVDTYEQTGGREGAELEGKPCVVLWTRGRHSGAVRKNPLMRVRHGEQYAVVASMGGAPKHPVWYLNLAASPTVSLQDGPELKDYIAHTATAAEKAEWWPRATAVWPDYDKYQQSTDREIPLVILDPVAS
jgi:deazaflavin-dependent oxidoreductase (nitroreductase family)